MSMEVGCVIQFKTNRNMHGHTDLGKQMLEAVWELFIIPHLPTILRHECVSMNANVIKHRLLIIDP